MQEAEWREGVLLPGEGYFFDCGGGDFTPTKKEQWEAGIEF